VRVESEALFLCSFWSRFMRNVSFKPIAVPAVLVAALALGGCGTTTGTRTASGALMGAAGGALIGSLSAQAGAGALVGLGAGALGGYLYDQHRKGNL
jgi:hypothetical protein